MFGQFIRSQCNKQVSRRTKTLKFSSRFGKSIFIVIYFTRYTSREMELSDRLSRSTKYILHRSEVHRLFHFYTDQRDWYTWLEHLRAKAAADAHDIISFLYCFLHIYDDLSNLYLLSAWNVVVRFLFAFLYLHVVNRDIWFATSPPRDILQSECDLLQNPCFEVYHIHFCSRHFWIISTRSTYKSEKTLYTRTSRWSISISWSV